LDNATRHASTRVTVSVRALDDQVRLEVGDDGPGVPEAEREVVFERFHRGDPARTRGTPGTGLGLAIARGLAERAHGSLVVVDGAPGATFRLTLPALESAGGGQPV
jgi:signal transduction histidine kinase